MGEITALQRQRWVRSRWGAGLSGGGGAGLSWGGGAGLSWGGGAGLSWGGGAGLSWGGGAGLSEGGGAGLSWGGGLSFTSGFNSCSSHSVFVTLCHPAVEAAQSTQVALHEVGLHLLNVIVLVLAQSLWSLQVRKLGQAIYRYLIPPPPHPPT